MTKNLLNSPEAREMEEKIKTNHVKGVVQLDAYEGSDINLSGWELTQVLDDILFVEYADTDDDGKTINRGGLHVPLNVNTMAWRIGKVVLAGPNATVKTGDYVMFPNDKGLQAANVNGRKKVVFLNEARIFGVVKKA